MSTYLKHMGGYTYKQLKGKMEKEKESDKVEKVDDVDEAELKKLLVIKKDEDIATDAIPLSTKLPVIIDYKLHKECMMVHYQLIRADGSSRRYSSMKWMLQGIDREDLEALWKIVKVKYGDIRPENEFERVLRGDLKVMFEPDKRGDVWRILQGYRVTIWKLIDSSGVHFVSAAGERITTIVEIVLWYLDFGCPKHMTGQRDKLINFVSKFIGLGHNLFSVGQFCDSDLEVAFRKHTFFVRNLEGVDLLSGSCGSNLYTISLEYMMKSSLICLLSKASKTKSWLWHHCLSHLNFGTINQLTKEGLFRGLPKLKYAKDHLCLECQMGKSKKESLKPKSEPRTNKRLQMAAYGSL
ncbi:retrovirus-related pol polyprotein from transposon TNT 1-94 [Tanacetum coccineum]